MSFQQEVPDFERLITQLTSRLDVLHTLPTLAGIESIEAALRSLPRQISEEGAGAAEAIDYVERVVLPGLAGGQAGPRYFGFVTGGSVPAALYGDILTSMYDQNVQVNLPRETVSTVVESRTLEMVLDLLNLPADVFKLRTITTGATASNVLGLAAGRDFAVRNALNDPSHSVAEDGFGGVVVKVLSDRPHASLLKATSVVGIGRSNVIDLYDSVNQGINLDELERHLSTKDSSHKTGFIVSPSVGEVNTGEFTTHLAQIRMLCDKYHAWMHVDAAFGAFARILPELKHFASGLELADSITSDGHKWLNVPYDAGLFFSRSLELQTSVFGPSSRSAPPAYLTPSLGSSDVSPELQDALTNLPSPLNIGIENSRRFRALPMFCALISLGRKGYQDIVRRNVQFARDVGRWMSEGEGKEWYEVLNATYDMDHSGHRAAVVPLNIVLFRARGPTPALFGPNEVDGLGSIRLVQAVNATRKMYVSPGKGGVRLAVSNWMTGLRTNDEGNGDLNIVKETLRGVMLDALQTE